MLWFILGGVLFLLGLVFIFMAIKDPYEGWGIGATITLIVAVVVVLLSYSAVIDWQTKVAKFDIVSQTIENKITKINEMRRTYYEPPKNTAVNIDMVNKDLAQSINYEIKDLEIYINRYNSDIASWKIAYDNRFYTCCFVKPENKPILMLKDFNLR